MNDITSSVVDFDVQQVFLKWPAFFTLQDNYKIKSLQLRYWGDHCHSYLLKNNLLRNKTSDVLNLKIFENDQFGVKKRLANEEIMTILDQMKKDGKIEWGSSKDSFTVFKYSFVEIADAVYNWARKNGKIGSLETLKWIVSGDDTDPSEKFYNLPEELVLKSLELLSQNNKAQLIEIERGRFGVKFLN